MKFTGERFIPTEQGRIRIEHYHRYAMVLDIVQGKTVLDVACGEGYGSFLMAEVAHSVVGVDISDEAVRHASSAYSNQNLKFIQGSASSLLFPNDSFDVVVSFETIEHLLEQEEMIAEIRRVLRPSGVLVISSPNRPIYSEESGEHNEFHVKELDFGEFDELLKTRFPAVQYFGQRILMGSFVQPLDGEVSSFTAWHDDGKDINPAAAKMIGPVYFLAVCGADYKNLPLLDASIFCPSELDLVKHYVGFAKWAQSVDKTLAERDSLIASLNQKLTERDDLITSMIASLSQTLIETERDGLIASLSQKLTERDGLVANLNQMLSACNGQIASVNQTAQAEHDRLIAILESSSWKWTKPLRELQRWISSPRKQIRRYSKASLLIPKRTYQSLPISNERKARYRRLVSKSFPRLLLALGSPLETIPELYAAKVAVPVFDHPLVSVIIPAYGNIDYTLRCLGSIAATAPQASFEVIVVDDCSPDDSADLLLKVKGIRLFKNEQNQGFIRSCNTGAKAAKGEYLYFLNNDTEVTPGWLDELLQTFQEFPGTGLAGSKLLYNDHCLQEAGGIIWQDGSAWNYGRLHDPLLPIYNYAREVDYCSGASIMVPKVLFDELGGFDEHYLPAYCEDSDLALKIRDKGHRVIYQPLSSVVHFEGITSGTDTSHGTKAYQVENSKKLFERWHERLGKHQQPGRDVDAAKDRRATRRVLVLDHCVPTPDQDAGSVTTFNILLLLREMDFQVTFGAVAQFSNVPHYTANLQRAGIEMLYAPYVLSIEQHLVECGERYDLVFLFRPGVVEQYLKAVRQHCTKAKVLYHTVDLHFLRMSREAELLSDEVKQQVANEMKLRELTAICDVDAAIVHSTAELELLRPMLPDAKLHVFPLILNIKGTSNTFARRRDIVFVGGFQHIPNVDAVLYFVKEIMPLLRKQLPGVRFFAVGSKTPAEIEVLASEDVIIAGFVEDLTQLFDKMRVSVAPLRYGAGIKGKIGTAMAVGLPVVATSLAAEGMSLTENENILVADGPEALAGAVAKIYQDEALWNRISQNSLVFAEKAWGSEAAFKILATILADSGIKVMRGKYPLSLYSERINSVQDITSINSPSHELLNPINSVKNKIDFELTLQSDSINYVAVYEKQLLEESNVETFVVDGFCVPCEKSVHFLVDMEAGGQRHANGWTPNWRERMVCPMCGMNNRQRLIATLMKQTLSGMQGQKVYLMEQVTPIFNWASAMLKQHQIFGSEYLGPEYPGGALVKGIRHEDVECLSFADGQIDLIVSNDVFEHVPNPAKAFAECARVLRSGGIMLATIPFHNGNDLSVIRARLCDGKIEHILHPVFHGNPLSADGSLVFTDFGWDILNIMNVSGFSDVFLDIYASRELGHLGGGQLVFRLVK